FKSASAHAERARALAERMDDSVSLAMALNVRGYSAFQLGEWPHARADFEQSVALMRQAGFPWSAAHPLGNLGTLLLPEGDWEQAASYFDQTLKLAEQSQNLDALRWSQSTLAERELLLGQPEAAYERLKPLLDDPNQQGSGTAFVMASLAWAEL